jgi:hypothetical protein
VAEKGLKTNATAFLRERYCIKKEMLLRLILGCMAGHGKWAENGIGFCQSGNWHVPTGKDNIKKRNKKL